MTFRANPVSENQRPGFFRKERNMTRPTHLRVVPDHPPQRRRELRPVSTKVDDLDVLIQHWARHLKQDDKAVSTMKGYLLTATTFREFLLSKGLPTEVTAIDSDAVKDFLVDQRECNSRSTEATRYAHLVQFFRWLDEEDEIVATPMGSVKRPRPEEQPVQTINTEDLKRLIGMCKGKTFRDKRDAAILTLFLDSGARRAELSGLKIEDLDLDNERMYVYGKGRKERWVPIGRKAMKALDRYIRARHLQDDADSDYLWLGLKGPLTDSGVAQMLRRRAKGAGLGHLHLHQFRHTFCHLWKLRGGSDVELAALMGWSSTQMAQRYGASAVSERARAAHKRLSPGDLL